MDFLHIPNTHIKHKIYDHTLWAAVAGETKNQKFIHGKYLSRDGGLKTA